MCNNVMYPEGMEKKPERPDQLSPEKIMRMAGKPVFFIGSDYNNTVRIVEWRVIDYIIIRKDGMYVYFTDSKNEYNANRFKAYLQEVYPIDQDFLEYEDADYSELVTRIRDKYRRGED